MPDQQPCRECGKPFTPTRRPALHCSTLCRTTFNRRRHDRGAELYDFIMAGKTDTVKDLVASYKRADHELRQGRPSYQPTQQAMMALSYTQLHHFAGDNR